MPRYDVVIVGGGHNGLTAGCYLARTGLSVLVLERKERAGGACITEEVFPGFRINAASYTLGMLQPETINELGLESFGFQSYVRDPQFTAPMGLMPEVTWDATDKGVKAISDRRLPDGTVLHRISEAVLPTLRVIPNPRVAQYARVETIGWVLPLDDTSFRIYTAGRVRKPGEIASVRSRLKRRLWQELTAAEHRDFPGDYEAQVGQGPIT